MASLELTSITTTIVLLLSSSFTHLTPTQGQKQATTPSNSDLDDIDPLLVIDLLREDRVDGSYLSPSLGYGIIFNSTRDSLTVSTMNGSRLMAAEEKVGAVRLISLGDREFVQHREEKKASSVGHEGVSEVSVREYAIPRRHGSFAGTRNDKGFTNLLEKLQKVDRSVHARVMEKSMRRVLSEPETKLLHQAAVAMGQRGITGRDYPAALPLYLTAMRLDSHHPFQSNSPLQSDNPASERLRLVHRARRNAQVCLAKCPPCKGEECLGMCGYSCTCWDWACGDCCYHEGCYYHDLCCRSKPDSLACWVPLEFECDKKYICTDPF